MALRSSTLLPSTVTRTLICIDNIRDLEFAGRLFSPFMPETANFLGIMDFIGIMDGFFNDIGFPQAYYSERFFDEKKTELAGSRKERVQYAEVVRYFDDSDFELYKGKIVSFVIQVQFRQNATWQGTVEWRDKKRKRGFRSILELIKLMDEAVQMSTRRESFSGWGV